ncbi:MAG: helix-turn-helix domain-containing protein [Clostridia bacterium]|nr:helix-turn-helix domain-containing protein [Clostridia bacterium]
MAFFKVDNRIFSFDLKPRDLAVYFCLCRHASNEGGTCFPSRRTIARECGISGAETVDRALKVLLELGLIEKQHQVAENGSYRSNLYRVLPLP